LPATTNPDAFSPDQFASKVADMKTPQPLSREAIEEFKAIYQEEFGEILSDDEVREIATRLLRFFGIMVRQIPGKAEDQTAIGEQSH
jgi:hypothetical protein